MVLGLAGSRSLAASPAQTGESWSARQVHRPSHSQASCCLQLIGPIRTRLPGASWRRSSVNYRRRHLESCAAKKPAFDQYEPIDDPPRQLVETDDPQQYEEGHRGGWEWLTQEKEKFSPNTTKAENMVVLDFEKHIYQFEKKLNEVRAAAREADPEMDLSMEVKALEAKIAQMRRETYARLTPIQRLSVARHPNRPTFLDIAYTISDRFIELHGDKCGQDDPAIVCGLGDIDGTTFMMIGHQKGRNTKENIKRNFGMPTPQGYRKALRFMQYADKFSFPIVTFIDTPGAYASISAEETGQGEAIARNLREMFNLRTPVISIVIGEGGSGGALAIGCANYTYILDNAVYYVASPEACASILFKSRNRTPTAAEMLRITAKELCDLGIMDEVIREPLGGSQQDPYATMMSIKKAILKSWRGQYSKMTQDEILADRFYKFRKLGRYNEYTVTGGSASDKALLEEYQAEGGGVHTSAGTWAPSTWELDIISKMTARSMQVDRVIESKRDLLRRPDNLDEVREDMMEKAFVVSAFDTLELQMKRSLEQTESDVREALREVSEGLAGLSEEERSEGVKELAALDQLLQDVLLGLEEVIDDEDEYGDPMAESGDDEQDGPVVEHEGSGGWEAIGDEAGTGPNPWAEADTADQNGAASNGAGYRKLGAEA